MGGELLKIDLAEVDTTAEKLGFIASNLRSAEGDAEALAGMIPHDGLAGCVEKFGTDWDKAREELIAKVEDAHKVGKKIFEAFTDADAQLAGALERK
jgi:hypothetical protein